LKKVLIFPAGSEVGLEIYECLKDSIHFELIGATSTEDHSSYVFPKLFKLPFISAKNFIHEIEQLITTENIDYVFPAMDEVLLVLKKEGGMLGAKTIGPSLEIVEIVNDKEKTYNYFEKLIRVPRIVKNIPKSSDYPLFLKPKIGYGSRGVHKIESERDLNYWRHTCIDHLLIEYLPGEEYTIDCFTNSSGDLLYCSPRGRDRIRIGISVSTSFASKAICEESLELAQKINNVIEMRGNWFFQIKRSKSQELCLLEIGLRIAGSSSLNRLRDVNLPLLTLFDYESLQVTIDPLLIEGSIDRAFSVRARFYFEFERLYMDLDDCLLLTDRLNPKAVELIINCRNAGKEIILITKHAQDLQVTLAKYKISGLFDQLIHLNIEHKKSDFILPGSLFVDDSFAERQAANKLSNVFSFGVHSLSLLNSSFL
jgi:hypothetical protein